MPKDSDERKYEQLLDLTKEYATTSAVIAEALVGLKGAMKDINDTSVLHANTIQANTEAIKSIERFWGSIVKWLTIAIIIIAGVKEASKLFGIGL